MCVSACGGRMTDFIIFETGPFVLHLMHQATWSTSFLGFSVFSSSRCEHWGLRCTLPVQLYVVSGYPVLTL